MRRTLVIALLLTLAALPAAAQKVYIDFDESADFASYKTFAWGRTPEVSLQDNSPLMHSRLKNAIEYQLTTGGLIEDTENPDLYVTYHGESETEMRVDTHSWGYGYGRGWRWDPYWGGGYGDTTTTVRQYDVGTLVIDIWDAKEKSLIWRGTATKTIPSKPEKQAKLIDEAVAKLARQWEKKYHRGRE
jgi:hypothetical protein